MKRLHSFLGLLMVLLALALLCGWFVNIVKLWNTEAVNGFAILRGIGVFVAPLGGVLGWL